MKSLLCLALLLASLTWSHAADQRPNILVFVSDDQGYADLGSYGNQEIQTPNLDRLAQQGMRMTSYYVAWSACGPSRAAWLTGRYPQRNGMFENIRNNMVNYDHRYTEHEYAFSPEMTLGLDLREITIAQSLKSAGYRNGIFGKWDSGRAHRFLPLQRGFDDFYGFSNTGIDYWTHERYGIHSVFRGNQRTREDQGTYFTYLVKREAIRFLKESADQPFFLYVPFFAPHGASNLEGTGIRPPQQYLDLYNESVPNGKREYMAAVSCMDDMIGEILQTLEEIGQAENTLVVFFSDNGGAAAPRRANNGPLRGAKGSMFDGGFRVPFIARWPGQIPAGSVSDAFVSSLDLFPTLLHITGAPRPDAVLDGFNILPVLRGQGQSQRNEMFWERLRMGRAARVGNWKWVESEQGGGLFDLAADIGEQNDLSEERPEILRLVKSRYEAWAWEMDHALEPRGPFRNY